MLRLSSRADLGGGEQSAIGVVEDADNGIYVLVRLYGESDCLGEIGTGIADVVADQYRFRKSRLVQEGRWTSCSFGDIQGVLSLSMASSMPAFLELGKGQEFRGYSVIAFADYRDRAIIGNLGANQFLLVRNGELHRMICGSGGARRGPVDRASSQRSFDSLQLYQRQYNELVSFDLLPGDKCILCDADVAEAIIALKGVAGMIESSGLSALSGVLSEQQKKEKSTIFPAVLVESIHNSPPAEKDIFRQEEILGCIAALRKVYLLQDLDYAQILKILEISTVSDHGVGLPVILQGSTGNSIYVIITGEVSVQIGSTVLAMLKSSDHFGEMALLNHSRRNASVYPKSPTRLLTIPGDSLRKLLVEDPAIGVKLLWQLATELSNRLVSSNQKLQSKAYSDQDQDTIRIELGFSTIGD